MMVSFFQTRRWLFIFPCFLLPLLLLIFTWLFSVDAPVTAQNLATNTPCGQSAPAFYPNGQASVATNTPIPPCLPTASPSQPVRFRLTFTLPPCVELAPAFVPKGIKTSTPDPASAPTLTATPCVSLRDKVAPNQDAPTFCPPCVICGEQQVCTFTPTKTPTPTLTPTLTATGPTSTPTIPVTTIPTLIASSTVYAGNPCTVSTVGNAQVQLSKYLAPIAGNPRYPELTPKSSSFTFDAYAVDPLRNTLWFHLVADQEFNPPITSYPNTLPTRWWGWVEIISSSGTGTITLNNSIVLVPTEKVPQTKDSSQYQFPLNLTLADIINCVQQIPNVSLALPDLNQVSWTNPSAIPVFTFAPVAAASMCQWTSANKNEPKFWGFGYSPAQGTPTPSVTWGYANKQNWHMGHDFFVQEGSSVYSVADNGLIVGIGIGSKKGNAMLQSSTSGTRWGAAYVENGLSLGYNVIVRYASIYVLYGHIRNLDPNIYVGKVVNAGDRLGAVGQVGNPHLHIEARNLGFPIPSDIVLLKVPTNPFISQSVFQDNKFGILSISSKPGNSNDHDIGQFFRSPIDAYAQDFDSGATHLSITGFGLAFDVKEAVQLTPTAMRTRVDVVTIGNNCTIYNSRRILSPALPENHGIRGFQNGKGTVNGGVQAADPDISNSPPSYYPTATIVVTSSPTATFTATP